MNTDEIELLKSQLAAAQEEISELEAAHAAAVLSNVQLRERIASTNILLDAVCAINPDSRCANHELSVNREALAAPISTEALDAYVAEKVKEADDKVLAAKNLLAIMHRDGGHHEFAVGFDQAIQDAMAMYYELTNQRDLAVGALIGIENFAVQPWAGMATEALSAIKESEANPKATPR